MLDRVGAAVLLVLVAPMLLVLAILVWSCAGGPILFRQQRIGLDHRPFTMLKFRTMELGAEARLTEVLAGAGIEPGPLYKVVSDPRITTHGAWMRRLSLDELPQLVNVLRGEMSLVGPRPQVAFETATYTAWESRRLLVKPGMTGLWQTQGRSRLSWKEAVRLDVYYVENWSIVLDLRLLWRTVGTLCEARGAY